MHIFHQRPLALAACLYTLFALLAVKLSSWAHLLLLILVAGFLTVLAICFFLKRHVGKQGIFALLCVCAILLSLGTSYCFFQIRYANLQDRIGVPCDADGQVIERLSGDSYYSRFRVQIDGLDGERESFGALLECDYPSSLQAGDRFRVTATPRAFEADEFFDEESYSLSDGCMLILESHANDPHTILPSEDLPLSVWASNLNLKLSYSLRQRTDEGLSARLLLGNTEFLSDVEEMRFSRAGVSHLLALSGLHVSILIGFLEFLLRRLRLPKIARAAMIPVAAIGYLILTGCSVSATRAVLMVCILYLAYLWKGDYDPFTALSLALVLILQLSPYAVYDLSLWLSFTAAASIILFMPLVQKGLDAWREKTRLPSFVFHPLRALISAISVGVIVNVALLPLSAIFFGELSIWSIPMTLLFSIPVALVLVLGAVAVVLPFVPLVGELCGAISTWMLNLTRDLTEIEFGLLPLQNADCTVAVLLLGIALLLLAVLPIRKLRHFLIVPILCVGVICSSVFGIYAPEKQVWSVNTLEVARGNVRIYTKEGNAVVVNHTEGAVNLAYEIKQSVNREMCTEIESLIFCELYPQAPYFLSKISSRLLVRNLYLPMPKDEREESIARSICKSAERYGIEVFFDARDQLLQYEKME